MVHGRGGMGREGAARFIKIYFYTYTYCKTINTRNGPIPDGGELLQTYFFIVFLPHAHEIHENLKLKNSGKKPSVRCREKKCYYAFDALEILPSIKPNTVTTFFRRINY